MTLKKYLFILGAVCLLASCGESHTETVLKKIEMASSSLGIEDSLVYYYRSDDAMLVEAKSLKQGAISYTYDDSTRVLSETTILNGDTTNVLLYTYNEKGDTLSIVTKKCLDENNHKGLMTVGKVVYVYDATGNKTTGYTYFVETSYFEDYGLQLDFCCYKYNKQGQIVQNDRCMGSSSDFHIADVSELSPEEEFKSYTSQLDSEPTTNFYKYNKEGDLIEDKFCTANTTNFTTAYTYNKVKDASGRITSLKVKKTRTSSYETTTDEEDIKIKYNENGDTLEYVRIVTGSGFDPVIRNKVSCVYFAESGKLKTRYEYQTGIYNDATTVEKTTYEERGTMLKSEFFLGYGPVEIDEGFKIFPEEFFKKTLQGMSHSLEPDRYRKYHYIDILIDNTLWAKIKSFFTDFNAGEHSVSIV